MENIIVKSENKKCKSCGGSVVFSPSFQCLICEKCQSKTDIDKNEKYEKHIYEKDKDYSTKVNIKTDNKCKNCGAQIDTQNGEISAICPYCSSAFVQDLKETSAIKPDFVVPFLIDKNQAIEKFKKGVKKKIFVPNAFKKQQNIKNVESFYFPVFSFDENTNSSYVGSLGTTHTDRNGGSHTTYRNISGTIKLTHEDVLVESSSHLNQLQLEKILPYKISGSAMQYNDDFVRGFSLEYYVNSVQKCKKLADTIIEQNIKSSILSKYSYDFVSYLNVQTSANDEKYAHGVLPVYKFSYRFKEKEYSTLINGQTGKIGSGLPISKVKVGFTVFFSALLLVGIILLFVFFGE